MLFKDIHLKGIKAGKISLAFRRWQKASVRIGTLLHTSVGLIKIDDISEVDESHISETDAVNAGFSSKKELLNSLRKNNTGTVFKIKISYYSEDPRIELREQTDLTNGHISTLKSKLERLDKFSKQGAWTEKVLLIIRDNPHLKAIEISKQTGFEKEWLKINIRKLKNLGLTISHNVGYELSPLGKVLIEKLWSK